MIYKLSIMMSLSKVEDLIYNKGNDSDFIKSLEELKERYDPYVEDILIKLKEYALNQVSRYNVVSDYFVDKFYILMNKTYNSYSSGKHVFENTTCLFSGYIDVIKEVYSKNRKRKVDDEEKEYKIDNDNDKIITKEQFKLLEKYMIISFFIEHIIKKEESSGVSENLREKTKEFVEEWEEEMKKIEVE